MQNAAPANPIAATSYGVGVGSYKSGALVASDNDGSRWPTYVSYAAAGKSSSSAGTHRSAARGAGGGAPLSVASAT